MLGGPFKPSFGLSGCKLQPVIRALYQGTALAVPYQRGLMRALQAAGKSRG